VGSFDVHRDGRVEQSWCRLKPSNSGRFEAANVEVLTPVTSLRRMQQRLRLPRMEREERAMWSAVTALILASGGAHVHGHASFGGAHFAHAHVHGAHTRGGGAYWTPFP